MLPGVRRVFQKSRKRNRGQQNQLRISEALDQLRKFGYRIFHNLTRDGYHLDHVIVGPTGVFAIETKIGGGERDDTKVESQQCENILRSAGSSAKASFKEGRSLKAAAQHHVKVNQIISREFDGWIWPLLVIAGEWRVKNDPQMAAARLFTVDKLVNHVVDQQSRLTSTEIKLIVSHLERSAKSIVRLRKKTAG